MSEKTNCYMFNSILWFAIIVGGLVSLVMTLDAPILHGSGSAAGAAMTPAAINARIAPVGVLNTGAAIAAAPAPAPAASAAPAAPAASTAAAGGARSGSVIFHTVCFVCHATGAAGAPKVGDKAAWKPRIAKGIDTLWQHAIHGFQSNGLTMPPRGTCGNCSDAELKNAVEYMVSQSK